MNFLARPIYFIYIQTHTHTIEYYTGNENKLLQIKESIWTNLKHIMLNKRSKLQESTNTMTLFMLNFNTEKLNTILFKEICIYG